MNTNGVLIGYAEQRQYERDRTNFISSLKIVLFRIALSSIKLQS
jgi:hypothetical protein